MTLKKTALVAAMVSAAFAQGTSAQQLEEVVVTAQKRSENQQDVPIAMSTATAAKLENAGITSTIDLAQITPGLAMPVNVGRVTPRIRGVGAIANGPGQENSVAVYIDDVYLASANAAVFSLSNVDRVEVLKGPQGTLFGRNATGGVIHVVTKDPEQEVGGDVSVGYGNYDTFTTSGYVTGGIADNVAADLAVYYQSQQDGYGTNGFNGKDLHETPMDLAIRSKWLIDLGDVTTLRLSADYNKIETNQALAHQSWPGTTKTFGPTFYGSDGWDNHQDVEPMLENESWGVTARLDHDFGFASLASITAYRESTYDRVFDLDGTAEPALKSLFYSESEQFTQEFQLSSNSDGPLQWLAGLYYFNMEDILDAAQTNVAPPAAPITFASITANEPHNESVAGFGEISFDFSDRTTLTVGARYTYEERSVDNAYALRRFPDGREQFGYGPLDVETDFEKVTWRLALRHHFTDNFMGYASFNTGFKSGGFASANPTNPVFFPEELDAYEVGFKSEWLEQRVRLNGSAFYYDYTNLQVRRRESGLIAIFNGPGADVYGVDMDFEALVTDRLTLSGGFEIMEHEYTDFPEAAVKLPNECPTDPVIADGFISCPDGSGGFIGGARDVFLDVEGNGLSYTSDVMANLTVDYMIPLQNSQVNLSATYSYNDGYYFEPDNTRKQDPFDNLSASLLWRNGMDNVSVRLWGRNLTDEKVVQNYAAQNHGEQVFYTTPRTYGVTVKYKF